MSQDHANALRAGLFARIASLLGLGRRDKQPLLPCRDRMAALDDPQTRAALKLCDNVPASRKQHITVKGAGHYGIFSGKRWRDSVYPQVRDFIAAYHG